MSILLALYVFFLPLAALIEGLITPKLLEMGTYIKNLAYMEQSDTVNYS